MLVTCTEYCSCVQRLFKNSNALYGRQHSKVYIHGTKFMDFCTGQVFLKYGSSEVAVYDTCCTHYVHCVLVWPARLIVYMHNYMPSPPLTDTIYSTSCLSWSVMKCTHRIASSPGHSQFFNVAHVHIEKLGRGPFFLRAHIEKLGVAWGRN